MAARQQALCRLHPPQSKCRAAPRPRFASWEAMLPDAIEAFFYPVTGECALDTRCQIHTRAVHQAFLYHYSLDEAQVPLLKLHPQATGAHWDAPFDVDAGEWDVPGAHQLDARARISEG